MHVTINKKNEFEREKGVVYKRVCREESKGGNDVISYNLRKGKERKGKRNV